MRACLCRAAFRIGRRPFRVADLDARPALVQLTGEGAGTSSHQHDEIARAGHCACRCDLHSHAVPGEEVAEAVVLRDPSQAVERNASFRRREARQRRRGWRLPQTWPAAARCRRLFVPLASRRLPSLDRERNRPWCCGRATGFGRSALRWRSIPRRCGSARRRSTRSNPASRASPEARRSPSPINKFDQREAAACAPSSSAGPVLASTQQPAFVYLPPGPAARAWRSLWSTV